MMEKANPAQTLTDHGFLLLQILMNVPEEKLKSGTKEVNYVLTMKQYTTSISLSQLQLEMTVFWRSNFCRLLLDHSLSTDQMMS